MTRTPTFHCVLKGPDGKVANVYKFFSRRQAQEKARYLNSSVAGDAGARATVVHVPEEKSSTK